MGYVRTILRKASENWKIGLLSYIFGYVISLKITGVPNPTYYIPIKYSALLISGLVIFVYENYMYNGDNYLKSLPRVFFITLLIAISLIMLTFIQKSLLNLNVDITPFIGL